MISLVLCLDGDVPGEDAVEVSTPELFPRHLEIEDPKEDTAVSLSACISLKVDLSQGLTWYLNHSAV